jgi:Microcystin-dependent protein
MSDQFLGEIRVFPYNFAPLNWAQCNGQLLAISQNSALFSLLGISFGGDGRVTFALPNLQGRVPMGTGQGPTLSPRVLGEEGGSETVTVTLANVPAHTHMINTMSDPGTLQAPGSDRVLARSTNANPYQSVTTQNLVQMSPQMLSPFAGGGQPHTNLQPTLSLNFCIALNGVFPARS